MMFGNPFRKSITRALLLLVLLTDMAGCSFPQIAPAPFNCTDSLGCVTIAPGDPVIVGVLQTLSGGSAPGGIEQEHAIQLAAEQRNNQLLGHPLKLNVEDEHCSAEGGANAVLKVATDPQLVGILGTNCSSAAVTAGKIMSEKGLVMISSANTSPILTSVGGKRATNWYPGYFRTAWNDTAMGQAAATFAYTKLGLKKAAVVNSGDAYTKGLTDVFAEVFESLGGTLVLETTIDEEDDNQRPMLEAVVLSEAEMIFFPLSHPETGSRIVRQARAMPQLEKLVFVGGEGMLSNVFILQVGPAGEGVNVLGPTAPSNPENDRLRQSYFNRYKIEPASFYYSFAYDAANLLFSTIETVAQKEADGTLHLGRQALRDALYHTRDFQGLTGTLNCNEFGDCGVAYLNIVRLDDPNWTVEELRRNVIFTYSSSMNP